jgi:HSP20 family protein
VAEHGDAIVVRAEVPGCKPEEIDISVYGNTLTISGEKKQSKEEKDKGYYHMETTYGSFRRDINLPSDVDSAKVEATCKDGVLSITLPKAEVSKAVKVQVKQ